jgi:hypothetical protein
MEQDPNLFAQGRAGRDLMEQTLAPVEADTPTQAARKRRALQRWYQARSQALRRRYERWMTRRSLERRVGSGDLNTMGRYAVDHAFDAAERPKGRLPSKRAFETIRRWRLFVGQTLGRRSSEYQNHYSYMQRRTPPR